MEPFNIFLIVMAVVAVFVFLALQFVDAGYGMFRSKNWGLSVNNKVGWFLMESPVFVLMALLWLNSDRIFNPACLCFFLFFQLHYFNRAFIYPFLLRGNSRMPVAIICMGAFFNVLNAAMQGGWIFYFSPDGLYTAEWFTKPQFWIGSFIFFTGMFINIQSDSIIRNLRKEGDTKHYLPRGGAFKYVNSANYFGELVEWTGFAILTWSWAGAVFAWWTFANLAPRAFAIYKKYEQLFGEEFKKENRKRILPFIY